jgi:hypothetical protein
MAGLDRRSPLDVRTAGQASSGTRTGLVLLLSAARRPRHVRRRIDRAQNFLRQAVLFAGLLLRHPWAAGGRVQIAHARDGLKGRFSPINTAMMVKVSGGEVKLDL